VYSPHRDPIAVGKRRPLPHVHHAVAVQVAFESKGLKPVFHVSSSRGETKPVFHFIGSRVETRRFLAMGQTGFNLYRGPHHALAPLRVLRVRGVGVTREGYTMGKQSEEEAREAIEAREASEEKPEVSNNKENNGGWRLRRGRQHVENLLGNMNFPTLGRRA
jgi:hypothetical protein